MSKVYDDAVATYDYVSTDYDGNDEGLTDDTVRIHAKQYIRPKLGRSPLATRRSTGGTPGRR